jgi:hypothetical protein
MTGKNLAQDVYMRYQKSIDPDATWYDKQPHYEESAWKVLDFSPPLSIKLRKLVQAAKNWEYNEWKHDEDPWGIDDPAWLSSAYVISSITNVPLDRLVKKITNVRGAVEADQDWWKRVALLSGWQEWELETSGERGDRMEDEKTKKRESKAKENPGLYNKREQVDILKQIGLSEYQIKNLGSKEKRVEMILKYQKKDKKIYKPKIKPPTREYKDLEKKNKDDQVKILKNLGYSTIQINGFKTEEDRIMKILKARDEDKKVK